MNTEIIVIIAATVVLTSAIIAISTLIARRLALTPNSAILNNATWGGIMTQLQKQLETRDAKIQLLETEGGQLRIEVNNLRNEVQIWQTKATELQNALDVFTRQLGENQRRMTSLEHEMETLHIENQRLRQTSNAPTDLRTLLTTRMNSDEIRAVCQDLKVDYDSLTGEGHAAKVLALIDYMTRRDDRELLIKTIKKQRSDIPL